MPEKFTDRLGAPVREGTYVTVTRVDSLTKKPITYAGEIKEFATDSVGPYAVIRVWNEGGECFGRKAKADWDGERPARLSSCERAERPYSLRKWRSSDARFETMVEKRSEALKKIRERKRRIAERQARARKR
jgi:hypothetical protein